MEVTDQFRTFFNVSFDVDWLDYFSNVALLSFELVDFLVSDNPS